MKRLRVCLALTLAMLLVTVSVASAGGNANPGVLPPNSRVQGLTYGEWSARLMQSVFGLPLSENPAAGAPWTGCYLERVGNVGLGVPFFGSGTFTCEMPVGTMLYLLVIASECSTLEPPPFYGSNEAELRACATSTAFADLQASIDGVAIQDVADYLVTSPLYQLTLPEGNVLGLPAGTGDSVAYGAFLMLAPLSPGQHTVHVHGAVPGAFEYDMTYFITVTN